MRNPLGIVASSYSIPDPYAGGTHTNWHTGSLPAGWSTSSTDIAYSGGTYVTNGAFFDGSWTHSESVTITSVSRIMGFNVTSWSDTYLEFGTNGPGGGNDYLSLNFSTSPGTVRRVHASWEGGLDIDPISSTPPTGFTVFAMTGSPTVTKVYFLQADGTVSSATGAPGVTPSKAITGEEVFIETGYYNDGVAGDFKLQDTFFKPNSVMTLGSIQTIARLWGWAG